MRRPIWCCNVVLVCAWPHGASYAEGIGQTHVTKNLEGIAVGRSYRIPDQSGLTIVYQLLREEGLFLGLSSGINIAGAVRYARERGAGQTVVTILCDSGLKYQSKLFNAEWLAAHCLDPTRPLESVMDCTQSVLNKKETPSLLHTIV